MGLDSGVESWSRPVTGHKGTTSRAPGPTSPVRPRREQQVCPRCGVCCRHGCSNPCGRVAEGKGGWPVLWPVHPSTVACSPQQSPRRDNGSSVKPRPKATRQVPPLSGPAQQGAWDPLPMFLKALPADILPAEPPGWSGWKGREALGGPSPGVLSPRHSALFKGWRTPAVTWPETLSPGRSSRSRARPWKTGQGPR